MLIRKAHPGDTASIFHLYREVAKNEREIARTEEEISRDYFESLIAGIEKGGIVLVGEDDTTKSIIAEIHASKYGIKIFDHVLTNLTVVVHPEHQGRGFGKNIFTAFLEEVVNEWKEIRRVELEARASNEKSLKLYQSLGFVQEGVMKNKTRNRDGSFEDSIMMAWENPDFVK